MPQYRTHQYGLKQYGLFQSSTTPERINGKWRFIRSRFGIMREGQLFWMYVHTAVTLNGNPKHLRIQTNQGEILYAKKLFVKKQAESWRLRIPEREELLESRSIQFKEERSD